MAGQGTKLVWFLITVHTLLWFAGTQGFRPALVGDNPHKQFIDNIKNDTQSTIGGINQSVSGDTSVTAQSLGFVNIIGGILTSPYSWVNQANIHSVLKLIFGVILAFTEVSVVVSFLRGVSLF